MKARLEETLQEPKVIENTVVQKITATCEKHGEYQTYKRKLLSLRGIETQGECLREKIIALEREYQVAERKRAHQEKLDLLRFSMFLNVLIWLLWITMNPSTVTQGSVYLFVSPILQNGLKG
ncbi:hypothetical protein [Arsenophonus endosymbiont of Aleurodicus floccissimus]|uniref:hypothetical protein n=1 Tax=Arsenophonus endosymbiont of Aleurodicus floccissimus TaxID=2152761 RepID=UPI001EDCFC32|nr:hypothetical protein [Arsenophonus endosymbiont of Aleurodicus floccissimus]